MNESASEQTITEDSDSCPLPRHQQKRNMLLFAGCMGLNYLAAPISYVGIVQASLCESLGATTFESNLPLSAYMGAAVMPLFILWYRPRVSQLKTTLFWCFLLEAIFTAFIPFILPAPLPNRFKIATIIAHAAIFGATNPTAVALCWEVLGRGVDARKRGWALSMAFGGGPFLAVVGSLISQLLLTGKFWKFTITPIESPWNFVALYAAVAPMMLVGAFFATQYIVPLPETEPDREPFAQGIFGGVWRFLDDPLLRTTLIVIVLCYMGNAITSNMNLYSEAVLGGSPKEYAGIQLAIRFGFKVFAGIALGWLVARVHPKAGLLATASLYVLGQLWAMFVSGPWYLLAFGIYGAGELVGVYAPNYLLAASRKSEIRRNQAFHTLMMMPASAAAGFFGWIAQKVGESTGSPATGFRTSFAICAALMATGILITLWKLPANPNPAEEN